MRKTRKKDPFVPRGRVSLRGAVGVSPEANGYVFIYDAVGKISGFGRVFKMIVIATTRYVRRSHGEG